MALRIIFAGTSEFAVPALQALLESEHTVCAVLTRPDRMAGRGLKLTPSPVKSYAEQHKLPVWQPDSLKNRAAQRTLDEYKADILVDAAYGVYLPPAVLDMFLFGCINIHPSLLPRWRGAAPIPRAIIAGDSETGVTIMQVDEGWDTGAILQQARIELGAAATSGELEHYLAELGAVLLLDTLVALETDQIEPLTQNEAESCYADKLTKAEGQINWHESARLIERKIRAYNPWPIAFSRCKKTTLRVWKALPVEEEVKAAVGTIVKADREGLDVATGEGVLRILELQLPGKKVLPVAEVLNSRRELLEVGTKFDG